MSACLLKPPFLSGRLTSMTLLTRIWTRRTPVDGRCLIVHNISHIGCIPTIALRRSTLIVVSPEASPDTTIEIAVKRRNYIIPTRRHRIYTVSHRGAAWSSVSEVCQRSSTEVCIYKLNTENVPAARCRCDMQQHSTGQVARSCVRWKMSSSTTSHGNSIAKRGVTVVAKDSRSFLPGTHRSKSHDTVSMWPRIFCRDVGKP